MLTSFDPSGLFCLEPEAEVKLIAMANDFANNLIQKSIKVAQHRNSFSSSQHIVISGSMDGEVDADTSFKPKNNKRKRVEVEDVAFVLRKNYGMEIPGLPGRSSKKRSLLSCMSRSSENVNLAAARVLVSAASVDDKVGSDGDQRVKPTEPAVTTGIPSKSATDT